MNEKQILFNSEMVRAVLSGRKTQTRRVVKPDLAAMFDEPRGAADIAAGYPWVELDGEKYKAVELSPYGRPGDLLWVRETHYQWGHWVGNGHTPAGKQRWRFVCDDEERVAYMDNPPYWVLTGHSHTIGWYVRPSIFMPRWASRITLRVAEVRVERVQDISEGAALAEGITADSVDRWQSGDDTPIGMFGELWDSINAKRGYGWDVNPWVWVVLFERLS